MKKSLLALAVLSAFAGAASAQSSVTLSGGIDAAIQRQGGETQMSTGNSGRTNFTLSGREDLGGGMYAFFALNHRFNQGTGAITSPNFWRQTWVGLGGGFGDVRLGRMLPPLQEFNGGFDPFGTETVGSTHTGGINAGSGGNARNSNAIYYRSPSLGGLQLHATIAAGDGNGTGAERPVGLGVIYAAGPLRAALAYDKNSQDHKTIGLYGAFNAGFAEFMGQYEKGDCSGANTASGGSIVPTDLVLNCASSAPVDGGDVKRWSLGAKVPMGAAALKVGYRNNSDEEWKKFGIGLDYNLSKRTMVYTDLGKISGDGASSDAKKTRFDVGVWHRF